MPGLAPRSIRIETTLSSFWLFAASSARRPSVFSAFTSTSHSTAS